MLGAVATTANPFYTSAEVFKQLNSFQAKLIITQSHYVSQKLCELKTLVSSPPPSMTF
jgi:4-coumarate--CoA ligase